MQQRKRKGLLCLISNILNNRDMNSLLRTRQRWRPDMFLRHWVSSGVATLGGTRCSQPSAPYSTGVGSELIVRDEGSLTKPVLRVRFPKHLPALFPLITIARLLSYHGGLRTSFPGTNRTKGKILAGEHGLW